jgi:sensor histidine kinase regulating citrate/malate metabolism
MKKTGLNLNKAVVTLVIINIIQIILFLVVMIYNRFLFDERVSLINIENKILILALIFGTIFINGFTAVKNMHVLIKANSQYNMQIETLKRVENLNNTLRAQRHDFLNHLQVVYSLIELDEYDDAKEYIERIYDDIKKVSRILKTSQPAINALLQAKLADCETRKINVNLNITSQLRELKIPSWEMCRVLANLIDNAIYELDKRNNKQRLLEIKISEDINNYSFMVKNNGSKIPEQIKHRIFEAAFTTKEEGQGMGLAITKEIIENNKGKIDVCSDDNFTQFTVTIPRQNIHTLKQTVQH